MKWVLLVGLVATLVGALAGTPAAAQTEKARLMAVFAHPDDEISIAPLLAKYAAEGHEVRLLTVTSGQVGDANTDVPRGDALGRAREAELGCSGKALGIQEPVPLRYMDGDIAGWDTLRELRERLREEMHGFAPHVVFTWGVDGLSGHPDHRLVGALTTEVFQEPWPDGTLPPQKLYTFVLPASAMAGRPAQPERAIVRDDFVTTVVDASAYLDEMLEAMHCHVTQWAPKERVASMFAERKAATGGRVALRLAMSTVDVELPESDVLAGLK